MNGADGGEEIRATSLSPEIGANARFHRTQTQLSPESGQTFRANEYRLTVRRDDEEGLGEDFTTDFFSIMDRTPKRIAEIAAPAVTSFELAETKYTPSNRGWNDLHLMQCSVRYYIDAQVLTLDEARELPGQEALIEQMTARPGAVVIHRRDGRYELAIPGTFDIISSTPDELPQEVAQREELPEEEIHTAEVGRGELVSAERNTRSELIEQVHASRDALRALTARAIELGADPSRLAHINTEQMWDENAFFVVSAEKMPPNRAGITLTETANVFLHEDRAGNFHDVAHESIHRAFQLGRLLNSRPRMESVIAGLYGFTISTDGRTLEPLDTARFNDLPTEAREESIRTTIEEIRNASEILSEGLTEWSTQRLHGLRTEQGLEVVIPEEANGYPLHTMMVEALHDIRGLQGDQVDALFLQTALSGDIMPLVEVCQKTGVPLHERLSFYSPILRNYLHRDEISREDNDN